MKRTVIVSLIATMVLSTAVAFAEQPDENTTGNGAPKAKLLGKVNIIGVKKAKADNMDDTGGAVIFVALGDKTLGAKSKIYLKEGPDFAVLDKNATDNDGGRIQLPPPFNGDGESTYPESAYSVFVRPLGKPGGWATITTCAQLLDDSTFGGLLSNTVLKTLNAECDENTLASVEQVGQDILTRDKGKSTFTNVTAELLSIVFKVEVEGADGIPVIEYVRLPIFDGLLEGEYWDYENHGLKLCQVRFYDQSTDVVNSDASLNNEP